MFNIAVYAIAKNESQHVDRWYESVQEADGIFVVDTVSDDDTFFKLGGKGVTVKVADVVPFRFDIARNISLDFVPEEFDFCLFLDMDETLQEGWYDELQTLLQSNPDATEVHFRMMFDQNTSYNRLMCHKRNAYRWHYPAHEVLIANKDVQAVPVFSDIEVYHKPDPNKDRSYLLELLKLGYRENPDARNSYYLGREYYFLGRYRDAILAAERDFDEHPWQQSERFRLLANCYEYLGDTKESRDYHTMSCAAAPDIRESWGEAAAFYFRVGRCYSAIGCIENMMDVESPPEHTVIRNDAYYRAWPFHMLAACYDKLGQIGEAQKAITKALELQPDDPSIINDALKLRD